MGSGFNTMQNMNQNMGGGFNSNMTGFNQQINPMNTGMGSMNSGMP